MVEVVVGIDASSKKIAAVVTMEDVGTQFPEVTVRRLPDSDIVVRCDWAQRHTYKIVHTYAKHGHDVYVFIEDPALGRGGANATVVQSEVRGAMLVGARRAGAKEIHGANNKRWKKVIVGNGNATKTQIKRHVKEHWPALYALAGEDEDVCDAGCINAYGTDVLRMVKRLERLRDRDVL